MPGVEAEYLENIHSDNRLVEGILSVFYAETRVEDITFSRLICENYDYSEEIPDSIFLSESDDPDEMPEYETDNSDE